MGQKFPNNKLFKQAYKLFNEERFEEALPLFLKLDTTLLKNNFYVKYYIGACYLNTKYDKKKAVPYLDYALKNRKEWMPKAVFLDLAKLYHLTYKFDKSEEMIDNFLGLANSKEDSSNIQYALLLKKIDERAKKYYNDSLNYFTYKIRYPISTDKCSEHNAYTTADGQLLFFTRTYLYKDSLILKDSVSKIFFAIKNDTVWNTPVAIKFDSLPNKDIELVGCSWNGQYLFLKIGKGNNSDIYYAKISGKKCDSLVKFPEGINSQFYEGGISFLPEKDIYYFSSNRPGGYGGKDIYKIVRNKDGSWGNPVNMGPTINSSYDEDYPFINPLGKVLYFTTNNPNITIGGYDIMRSEYSETNNSWSVPENMGYPINSTANDINLTTNAEGNTAYFSSTTNSNKGLYDLYYSEIESDIPYTMIKGFIYRKDTHKPISCKIKVYDVQNQKIVKYVYNPNPKTGRYLMILPPNKDYLMVVEAEGFKPYMLEIHVPHQSYFYELYQEILLEPITLLSEKNNIGEKIKVHNIFYDTKRFFTEDTSELGNIAKTKNYDVLINTVYDIVNLTDSAGLYYVNSLYSDKKQQKKMSAYEKNIKYNRLLNLVTKAIENTDTVLLSKIEENTAHKDIRETEYYYPENNKNDTSFLKKVIIGKDTLYVASVIKENTNNTNSIYTDITKGETQLKKTETDSIKKEIFTYSIYYSVNSSKISDMVKKKLLKIINLIKNNAKLYVELYGYASEEGEESYNRQLSYKRAFEVNRFFKKHGIEDKKIIINAQGELKGKNWRKNRRVDIKIIEKLK